MKKQSIVLVILFLSIASLSGCVNSNTTEKEKIEFIGTIYDVVFIESAKKGMEDIGYQTRIIFNNGTKEISIKNDCDQYTVTQAYSLARNNIDKTVKIIYTKEDNQLTWFEVLER